MKAKSEPRPPGSAERSDEVKNRLRKWRTMTASPTRTALLDAPSRSRLRLGTYLLRQHYLDWPVFAWNRSSMSRTLLPAAHAPGRAVLSNNAQMDGWFGDS